MTAAADEAWIQNSLARIEELEGKREQLAAAGQTDELAELDEEIHSLYEVLESVAGTDGPEGAPANTAGPAVAAPVAAVAAPDMAAPMGQPGMAAPMDATPSYDGLDDDIKPPRSPAMFILIGLVVVGVGVGAFMGMGKGDSDKPPPEPVGPTTVIKAGAVAEDTQEPQVAKGADADRTRGTNFKESSHKSSSSRPRRGGSSSRPRPSRDKKDDGRKLELNKSNDPLAGVN